MRLTEARPRRLPPVGCRRPDPGFERASPRREVGSGSTRGTRQSRATRGTHPGCPVAATSRACIKPVARLPWKACRAVPLYIPGLGASPGPPFRDHRPNLIGLDLSVLVLPPCLLGSAGTPR